jgi:hypothetical protein
MFKLSYTEKADGFIGTIKTRKQITGLGRIKDIFGQIWDINMAVLNNGINWVCACPIENLHPYYSSTSGASYGWISQHWNPYLVEVMKWADELPITTG